MIRNFSDHAANERTFLAWLRTGIAVAAFGFVIEKFNFFIAVMAGPAGRAMRPLDQYDGIVLIVIGIAVMLLGGVRFLYNEREINRAEIRTAGESRTALLLWSGLGFAAAALCIYLAVRSHIELQNMEKEGAMSQQGMIAVPSGATVNETAARLETVLKAKNQTIFARIDHGAGASAAGLTLRPTILVIFGNAKVGTALMQAEQSIGIELPLKALIWEDNGGKTWLGYTDPKSLAARYGLGAATAPTIDAMSGALAAIAKEATAR